MRIHFIAIGGSAMHNLAIALQQGGHEISGSDDQIFEPSRSRLAAKGLLPVQDGWFAEKITEELDAIILGMHAREDNPELQKAQELGINIFSYPEFLYEVSKDMTRVVIAGSHGKTTTTAMVLHAMQHAGMPTNYMVGAQLEGFDCMVELESGSEFMVMEGDEYLSSPIDRRPKFHLYRPNITVITGIAWDHINVFPTFEDYVDQFRQYLDTIEPGGALIYNEGDAVLKKLVEESDAPVKRFPYHLPVSTIEDGTTYIETAEGMMPLQVFGEHNLSNLEAARWICLEMGLQEDDFHDAIMSFSGAQNRMELLHEGSVKVFRDFAHAPSKVQAAVKALAAQFGTVRTVLELHTFSSLNPEFLPQYQGAMQGAHDAWVYFSPDAVAHKKLPSLSKEDVAAAFGPGVRVFDSAAALEEALRVPGENKAVVMMSSGNFGGIDLEAVFQTY
ncbi:MAG: UDP-N-acetylmuramate--L-alanyl-gamma-D-glutamyl-meso-2,6-diaminoheptandioate ligase [Cryomorphaceae bacterium]|nr:MAG: UDP-N-acetylmuramate--L-alanyl-gamma-D-glutamyl-meso-2,6-diaminoheptandioate ligase [Cryomorphaceae bacterium]